MHARIHSDDGDVDGFDTIDGCREMKRKASQSYGKNVVGLLQRFPETLSLEIFFSFLRSTCTSDISDKRVTSVACPRQSIRIPPIRIRSRWVFGRLVQTRRRGHSLFISKDISQRTFAVSLGSLKSLRRWKEHFYQHGKVIPPLSHRHPRKLDSDQISDLMAQTSVELDMYLDEIETWESFIETKKKESNECGERVGLYRITSGTKEAARRFAGGEGKRRLSLMSLAEVDRKKKKILRGTRFLGTAVMTTARVKVFPRVNIWARRVA